MRPRHLLGVLLAAAALAAPGVAFAQCTKDTDCKGDRVCERGTCVTPGERSQPPPPPPLVEAPPPGPVRPAPRQRPPPASAQGWDSGRKNFLSSNVLATINGFLIAASLQAQDPGLSIIALSAIYERALLPNVSLFVALTPSFWTDPVGFIPYYGITVGGKYYLFGEAPAGFWLGGELGNLPFNLGPGAGLEAGYQWMLESGLGLGVLGGVLFGAGAGGGIAPGFGMGGLVGWNF
jgi:hypothetical protein